MNEADAETIRELSRICTAAVSDGVPPEEIRSQLVEQGVPHELADFVLNAVAGEIGAQPQAADVAGFRARAAAVGQQLLDAGQSTVDLYHQMTAAAGEFFGDPERSTEAAHNATEAIASVHARSVATPLAADAFVANVLEDLQQIPEDVPAGPTSPLYPGALPRQFFFDPDKFLDMCVRMGPSCLDVLWKTTPGCGGLLAKGMSHNGKLKDKRRYLVLRLPPPEVRFEGHFLAFVGAGAAAPPRMFAMERGVAREESVLCERYADGGRLRLGAAGPAESKNFIRLVRQQLGL